TRSVSAFLLNRSSDLVRNIRALNGRFNTVGMGDAGIKSAIQGSNVPNPDEAVPSFVSGAMAKAGKGLLEGTLQAGTSAVSDKLLDLVGLGGKSAAEDRKSGSAGMPRPISYAVFCLKKKKKRGRERADDRVDDEPDAAARASRDSQHIVSPTVP